MDAVAIINGPSKLELAVALFEKHHQATFVANRRTYVMRVVAIAAEDGSRESWIVSGYIEDLGHQTILYNTAKRRGLLQPKS